MSKMLRRKKRRRLSKLLKSIYKIKSRIPTAPPSKVLKSKKKYDRRTCKEIVKKVLNHDG